MTGGSSKKANKRKKNETNELLEENKINQLNQVNLNELMQKMTKFTEITKRNQEANKKITERIKSQENKEVVTINMLLQKKTFRYKKVFNVYCVFICLNIISSNLRLVPILLLFKKDFMTIRVMWPMWSIFGLIWLGHIVHFGQKASLKLSNILSNPMKITPIKTNFYYY
jgi:hypothetical protein